MTFLFLSGVALGFALYQHMRHGRPNRLDLTSVAFGAGIAFFLSTWVTLLIVNKWLP